MGEKKRRQSEKSAPEFSWRILVLLLCLGAQTMIMEMAMPRILAPTFGNTLFCWTAIITVILAALAIGYYWGGRLASRKNAPGMIIFFSAFSAIWVLLLGVWGQRITPLFYGLGIKTGPLLTSILLAAVPAIFSAAILPMVVERRRSQAGLAAGESYAWSTIGSVAGVLSTGYLLLPYLGIKGTLMTASVLVFAALVLQGKTLIPAAGAVLAVAVYFMPASGYAQAVFDKSNGYHRIFVVESDPRKNIRSLFLDNSLEGSVRKDIAFPVLSYQQMIADIAGQVPGPESAFFIGGGAFTMPAYLKTIYPDISIDAAEIDPDVLFAARTFLGLKPDFNVLIGDGRCLLRERPEAYDLIVNDAFKGMKEIPFHLVTREFHSLVASKLTARGLYAVNVIGLPSRSRFTRSLLYTLSREFDHIAIVPNASGCTENIWILASRLPLHYGSPPHESEMDRLLFSDDRSPVEFLIARDFAG